MEYASSTFKRLLLIWVLGGGSMSLIGCSYETVKPDMISHIEAPPSTTDQMAKAIEIFCQTHRVSCFNRSQIHPSGSKVFMYSLMFNDGAEFNVYDDMEGKRYSVAVYARESSEWARYHDELTKYLSDAVMGFSSPKVN
jgi:hypothetical protein